VLVLRNYSKENVADLAQKAVVDRPEGVRLDCAAYRNMARGFKWCLRRDEMAQAPFGSFGATVLCA